MAVTRHGVCGRGTQLYGTPPCQSIGGVYLHRAVLGQLFEVLQPVSLQATAHAMADAEQRHRQQVAAFEKALERARFEADRAMRKHEPACRAPASTPSGRKRPGFTPEPARRPDGEGKKSPGNPGRPPRRDLWEPGGEVPPGYPTPGHPTCRRTGSGSRLSSKTRQCLPSAGAGARELR
jgi:hypothetical protein